MLRLPKIVVFCGTLAIFGISCLGGYQYSLANKQHPEKNPFKQIAKTNPPMVTYQIETTLPIESDKETMVGTIEGKASAYILPHIMAEYNPTMVTLTYQLKTPDGKTLLKSPNISSILDSEGRMEVKGINSFHRITFLFTQLPDSTYQAKIHMELSSDVLNPPAKTQ
jgi:hypothetical protein